MSSTTQQIVINGFVTPLTATAPSIALDFYQHIFEQHRHKIYSLAFWMTDNEITAEEISTTVFARTFSRTVPSRIHRRSQKTSTATWSQFCGNTCLSVPSRWK